MIEDDSFGSPKWMRDRIRHLEGRNRKMLEGLTLVINVLGPDPIKCGNESCMAEREIALSSAKEALNESI